MYVSLAAWEIMWMHSATSSFREPLPTWLISWQRSAAVRQGTVELSTLQRSASHMASRVDIDEAFMVGGAAVKAADEGDTGKMVVIDRVSDDPYMSATGIYDVHRIANEEKLVPRAWMNKDATYVTKDFVDYVKPVDPGRLPADHGKRSAKTSCAENETEIERLLILGKREGICI